MNRPITPLPNINGRNLPQSLNPRQDAAQRKTLIIGQDIRVQGDIQDVETLIVEGIVETPIIKAKSLIIRNSGTFHGEVEAQDVEIAGTLDGNLTVQGSLKINATGRLLGQAKCRRLQVEDGGQVTGQIEMITIDAAKPGSPIISEKKEEKIPLSEKDETSLA